MSVAEFERFVADDIAKWARIDLATEYAAAVPLRARERDLGRQFVAALGGEQTAGLRRAGGFEL